MAQKLRETGFDDDEIQEIFALAQDREFFFKAYGSAHMCSLVKSLVSASWMSFEFLGGILLPTCGTLAGTSLADMIFLAAFS
eukprot:2404692-Karenia_brevis.AAC.1